MSGIGQKAKKVIAGAGDLALEATRQVVSAHEDEAISAVANAERKTALECAAAALVEAEVPDSKITALLKKYFLCNNEEAAAALGRGRLMVERKAFIAKSREKATKAKSSNKK